MKNRSSEYARFLALFLVSFLVARLFLSSITPGTTTDSRPEPELPGDQETNSQRMSVTIRPEPPVDVMEPVDASAEANESTAPVETGAASAASNDPGSIGEDAPQSHRTAMSVGYRRFLGFRQYVVEMHRRGGRFFIFDSMGEDLLAEVDPLSGGLSEIEGTSLQGLSPQSRQLSAEIATVGILRKAQSQFGIRRLKVILLLPKNLDAMIQADIQAQLNRLELQEEVLVRLNGEYRLEAGSLKMMIHEAIAADGSRRSLSLTVVL